MRFPVCFVMFAFAAIPARAIDGDLEQGRAKSMVCTACHGPGGNSANPMYPVLAGKEASFLYARLRAYKNGEVKTANASIMQPMAAGLSDDDMKNLAKYFASQKPGEATGGRRKRRN